MCDVGLSDINGYKIFWNWCSRSLHPAAMKRGNCQSTSTKSACFCNWQAQKPHLHLAIRMKTRYPDKEKTHVKVEMRCNRNVIESAWPHLEVVWLASCSDLNEMLIKSVGCTGIQRASKQDGWKTRLELLIICLFGAMKQPKALFNKTTWQMKAIQVRNEFCTVRSSSVCEGVPCTHLCSWSALNKVYNLCIHRAVYAPVLQHAGTIFFSVLQVPNKLRIFLKRHFIVSPNSPTHKTFTSFKEACGWCASTSKDVMSRQMC